MTVEIGILSSKRGSYAYFHHGVIKQTTQKVCFSEKFFSQEVCVHCKRSLEYQFQVE